MHKTQIAVTGCLSTMPFSFPLDYPENAGNMIHARAPLEIFPEAVSSDTRCPPWANTSSFQSWVSKYASHVIVTLANFLRVNDTDGTPYRAFQNQLENLDAELVIFGLGAQATSTDLEGTSMPSEAIDLMKYLGERAKVIGVRGEFTKEVFRHFAGVENTFVTGCPSLFSRPQMINKLWNNIKNKKRGLPSYAGTVYHRDNETKMLCDAIRRDQFLIEPVNKFNHQLFLDSYLAPDKPQIPWYLKPKINDGTLSENLILSYFSKYYRLFRDADTWYKFNEDFVRFTYGSRFHVNMASVLSGVPALWLTHDTRTLEMVDFLHLPSLSLDEACQMSPEEIENSYDSTEFFDNIEGLFENFRNFLDVFDLPTDRVSLRLKRGE